MGENRRKWNSVDQLAGSVEELRLTQTEKFLGPSNLNSMKMFSSSTPMVFETAPQSNDEEPDLEDLPKEMPDAEDEDQVVSSMDGEELPPLVPTKNKARQKKYSRHFKKDDDVLEYYSCALAADILLQGYLYITKNYFAFYSNVFGRVTKILIPVVTIDKVVKSNIALIFPNAIHVHTDSEKHVFASFMSRETAFMLMNRVLGLKPRSENKKKTVTFPEVNPAVHAVTRSKEESRKKERRRAQDLQRRENLSSDSETEEQILREAVRVKESFSQAGKVDPLTVSPRLHNGKQIPETVITPPPPPPVLEIPRGSPAPADKAAPQRGWMKINKKRDKHLLRLCYVLIILLSISAVHLYSRIDAFLQEIPGSSGIAHLSEGEVLAHQQNVLHANYAYEIIDRINDNIKNINVVHEVLTQFSQQSIESVKRRGVE